jgi:hypothetical protein
MHKIIAAISAVTLAGGLALGAAAPVSAAPYYWDNHYHHNHYYRPGPAIGLGLGAGIFGFAAGAAIANSARGDSYRDRYYSDRDHIAACQDAYRSYDIRSDSYLGYDGYRHRCEL